MSRTFHGDQPGYLIRSASYGCHLGKWGLARIGMLGLHRHIAPNLPEGGPGPGSGSAGQVQLWDGRHLRGQVLTAKAARAF